MDRVARAEPILALIRAHESEPAVAAQGVESAYDVVWSGIKKEDRPRKLSALPVSRVLWWQDLIDPKYMSEAAGAYQIMEDTLRSLKLDANAVFDKDTQDGLALQLLDRRGWAQCEAGSMTPEDFADHLAREWASFPVVRDQRGANRQVKRGQSYYAGDGLNKAFAEPDDVLAAIRAALANAQVPVIAPSPAAEPQAPVSAAENAVVAWLMAAPPNTRAVVAWLAQAPEGVF